MQRAKQLRNTGFITFMISGVCAISSGVVVSLLQEMYGFSFAVTRCWFFAISQSLHTKVA